MTAATEHDVTTAYLPRVYNYWRGGLENLPPDRQLAGALEGLYPPGNGPRELTAANRTFLERATASAVHDGIGQVLDLGCGFLSMPRLKALHEVAQSARSSARVAYVDRDKLIVSHARSALREAGAQGVAAAECDLGNPGAVMGNPDVRSVIDPARPTLAVLGLVLNLTTPTDARRVVAGWREWLAPGSRIAVTVASWSDETVFGKVTAAFGPVVLHNFTAREVRGVMRGLDLLGGGEIEKARAWGVACVDREGPACIWAGVGRKS